MISFNFHLIVTNLQIIIDKIHRKDVLEIPNWSKNSYNTTLHVSFSKVTTTVVKELSNPILQYKKISHLSIDPFLNIAHTKESNHPSASSLNQATILEWLTRSN